MSLQFPIIAALLVLLLIGVNAVAVSRFSDRDRRMKARLAALRSSKAEYRKSWLELRFGRLERIGRVVAESPLVGAKEQQKMAAKLLEAGIPRPRRPRILVAIKSGTRREFHGGCLVGARGVRSDAARPHISNHRNHRPGAARVAVAGFGGVAHGEASAPQAQRRRGRCARPPHYLRRSRTRIGAGVG